MAATQVAQLSKKKQETGQTPMWKTQRELAESKLNSVLLVKKLLAMGFSEIAYLRMLYPEEYFMDANLEGKSVRVMRTGGPNSCKLASKLQNTFDALDKKYVYRNQDENDVIEAYTFSFKYEDEDVICEFYNKNKCYCTSETYSATTEAATKLLDNIRHILSAMPQLPEGILFKLKLGYRAGTPEDYNPPGFSTREMSTLLKFTGPNRQLTMGCVPTVVNSTSLTVRALDTQFPESLPEGVTYDENVTSPKQLEPDVSAEYGEVSNQKGASNKDGDSSDESEIIVPTKRRRTSPQVVDNAESTERAQVEEQNRPKRSKIDLNESVTRDSYPRRASSRNATASLDPIEEASTASPSVHSETNEKQSKEQIQGATDKEHGEDLEGGDDCNATVNLEASLTSSIEEVENDDENEMDVEKELIRCPCGKNQLIEWVMISCCACGLKSHVGCYGFPTEREVPDKVLCYFCARDNPELEEYRELCTVDPQMNPQQAMELCMFRRSLIVAMMSDSVEASSLMDQLDIDSKLALKLVRRLVKEGFLLKSRSKSHAVNRDEIEANGLSTYFVESDIVLSQPGEGEGEHEAEDQEDNENDMQSMSRDTNIVDIEEEAESPMDRDKEIEERIRNLSLKKVPTPARGSKRLASRTSSTPTIAEEKVSKKVSGTMKQSKLNLAVYESTPLARFGDVDTPMHAPTAAEGGAKKSQKKKAGLKKKK